MFSLHIDLFSTLFFVNIFCVCASVYSFHRLCQLHWDFFTYFSYRVFSSLSRVTHLHGRDGKSRGLTVQTLMLHFAVWNTQRFALESKFCRFSTAIECDSHVLWANCHVRTSVRRLNRQYFFFCSSFPSVCVFILDTSFENLHTKSEVWEKFRSNWINQSRWEEMLVGVWSETRNAWLLHLSRVDWDFSTNRLGVVMTHPRLNIGV